MDGMFVLIMVSKLFCCFFSFLNLLACLKKTYPKFTEPYRKKCIVVIMLVHGSKYKL